VPLSQLRRATGHVPYAGRCRAGPLSDAGRSQPGSDSICRQRRALTEERMVGNQSSIRQFSTVCTNSAGSRDSGGFAPPNLAAYLRRDRKALNTCPLAISTKPSATWRGIASGLISTRAFMGMVAAASIVILKFGLP